MARSLASPTRTGFSGWGIALATRGRRYLDLSSATTMARRPAQLYHNDGGGTFRDVTSDAGVGDTGSTYSVAWGDYDGDGLVDLIVTNHEGCNRIAIIGEGRRPGTTQTRRASQITLCDSNFAKRHNRSSANKLFRNLGDGTFTDVAAAVGVEDARAIRSPRLGGL